MEFKLTLTRKNSLSYWLMLECYEKIFHNYDIFITQIYLPTRINYLENNKIFIFERKQNDWNMEKTTVKWRKNLNSLSTKKRTRDLNEWLLQFEKKNTRERLGHLNIPKFLPNVQRWLKRVKNIEENDHLKIFHRNDPLPCPSRVNTILFAYLQIFRYRYYTIFNELSCDKNHFDLRNCF